MNCQEIKRNFSEAFDERLEPAALMGFSTHISTCQDCAADYARYQSLFIAVAALPAIENHDPVPYPETARAFRRPEVQPSLIRRLSAVAAMLFVLAGIGWLAFEAGRRGVDENRIDERAAIDPAEVVMPDFEAQKKIREVEDGARNLGALASVGPDYADISMVRALDYAKDSLRGSNRGIAQLSPDQFGSFHDEFQRTSGRIDILCGELEATLRVEASPEQRLRRARDQVLSFELQELLVGLSKLSRGAPEADADFPQDGDVNDYLLAALSRIGRRDASGALQLLEIVQDASGTRSSLLKNFARDTRRFVYREVGEAVPNLSEDAVGPDSPSALQDALRGYRLSTQQHVWVISTSQGDRIGFRSPGASRGPGQIVLYQRPSPKAASIRVRIVHPAPKSF